MATAGDSVNINLDPQTRYPAGEQVRLRATGPEDAKYEWRVTRAPTEADVQRAQDAIGASGARETTLDTADLQPGSYTIEVVRTDTTADGGEVVTESEVALEVERQPLEGIRQSIQSGLDIKIRQTHPTDDQALWSAMRMCLERRSFKRYRDFIDRVLCRREPERDDCGRLDQRSAECCYRHGVHGYELLKAATESWLLCHACCGEVSGANRGGLEETFASFDPEHERLRLGYEATPEAMQRRLREYLEASVTPGTLPYLGQIIENLGETDLAREGYPFCSTSIRGVSCMFELLWNYWLEWGMLVQTLGAISLRFQNRRVKARGRDVLANFELSPLRPLNQMLWGYIQDEDKRLTVPRRSYEYEHHYGLRLTGKAVNELDVAERRSNFLEAFHNLLHRASQFYKDSQNLMWKADAFSLLEAIRAVHLLLAEGAHNQWGDLPSTARSEALIQQWLLAQPPMGQFLQSRAMVPYDEAWMGPVDAMKKVMGWSDVSVIHFHKLATAGEQLLLSIRFGNWNAVSTTAEQAGNWAAYWKSAVQVYVESYRVVTGVDLGAPLQGGKQVDATPPEVLMQRRLREQRGAAE